MCSIRCKGVFYEVQGCVLLGVRVCSMRCKGVFY